MKKATALGLILGLTAWKSAAQTNNMHAIKTIGQCFGDSIVLRWAPSDPLAWKQLNKYGYRIERFTIMRDKTELSEKTGVPLNSDAILPAVESRWLKWIDTDDAAAIAAQCIFGENMAPAKNASIHEIVNKSKEQESRFSFALYAADMSAAAAQLSGLRWADKDIKKNERYLYRIHSLAPVEKMNIDYGFVYVGADEPYSLATPLPFQAVTIGRQTQLIYDAGPMEEMYSSYQFEKSDDGKNFSPLNKTPLAPMSENERSDKFIRITDSLAALNTPYYYRLRGRSPFAIWGPYSDTVKAVALPEVKAFADIVSAQEINGHISIAWDFPASELSKIVRFDVERAAASTGQFKSVNKSPIRPKTKTFTDKKPLPSNYYKVVSTDSAGRQVRSYPFLVQLLDSIPPAPPVDVKSAIDSSGHVLLRWKPNEEEDFNGYHVYRSNFKNAEFGRISKAFVKQPEFYDTVNVKTLSGNVYYKIAAFDNRVNQSTFSETVHLRRPDIMPPAPPSVTSISVQGDSVKLCWESASADVRAHRVFRQSAGETLKLMQNDAHNIFRDKPSETKIYEYKVEAEDSAGNKTSSQWVKIGYVKRNIPPVHWLKSSVNSEARRVTLRWESAPQAAKYVLYRARDEEPPALYKSVGADKNSYEDTGKAGAVKYWIRALLQDGGESPLSQVLKIEL